MKITFSMSGGLAHFPGLAEPIAVDTNELSADRGRELEALVGGTGVWDRIPETSGPPRPEPKRDARSYTVEIVDGERRCRRTLTDPLPEEWSLLVNALRAHQRRSA